MILKTTTTLEEILRNEASKYKNWDDIFNSKNGQFIRYGGEDALIYQVAKYTDMIADVADHAFFSGYKLSDENADRFFKKMFVNRFLVREIGFQTVDIFRTRLIGLLLQYEQYIVNTYKNYEKMFTGHSENSTDQKGQGLNKQRYAHISLPQNNVNIDLNNDNAEYADINDLTNNSSNNSNNSKTVSNKFSPDVLAKLQNVYQKVLDDFDKKLFLQVF